MMNVVGPLIELGINFVPVPGVKPAFDILNFIWQNVEKASNNKDALRNLAISAADILTAVNHVLEETEPNKHAQEMLYKLETVLTGNASFAEEHANMNLFKLLIKNIDVEGKIEFFQNRLQNIWVAFNIVALGDIAFEVHQLRQGRTAGRGLGGLPRGAGTETHTPIRVHPTTKTAPQRRNSPHLPQHPRAAPVLVDMSSSTPYRIEIRNGAPTLSSYYYYDEPFVHWGFEIPGVQTSKNFNTFEILDARESKTWYWALVGKVISISRHEQKHPQWKASMDMVFSSSGAAAYWFSWLELYVSSHPSIQNLQDPLASQITLRKKSSHALLRRSVYAIEYKRPTHDAWMTMLTGHAQSARDHTSQVTYISTLNHARLPFCRIYRSGDTLVHERFARADSLEPTFSRRYRFSDENEAQTWYFIWKDCAMADTDGGEDEPDEVGLTTKYQCEIKVNNDDPVLILTWGNLHLRNWGAPKFRAAESMVATNFEWINSPANNITVDAIIPSRPDWFANLDIEFPSVQSASAWFVYLSGRDAGERFLSSPRTEQVTVTHGRVCWMQNSGDFIQTREATSEDWITIFGQSYKKLEVHISYLSVVGTSTLPFIRIWRNGCTLYLERKRSAGDKEGRVVSQYAFDSEVIAQTWYDIWRGHFENVVWGNASD